MAVIAAEEKGELKVWWTDFAWAAFLQEIIYAAGKDSLCMQPYLVWTVMVLVGMHLLIE